MQVPVDRYRKDVAHKYADVPCDLLVVLNRVVISGLYDVINDLSKDQDNRYDMYHDEVCERRVRYGRDTVAECCSKLG